EAGIRLPAGTTEAVIRPLSSLPGDASLRVSCWELARVLSPKCGPTQPFVSKLCRVIRGVLEEVETDQERSNAHTHLKERKALSSDSPARERPFTGAVTRLANWPGFSVEIIVSNVDKMPSASNLYRVCGTMIERCQLVLGTFER